MSVVPSLCLVIATQRSGSTALCRNIAQLHALGRPREVFLRKPGDTTPIEIQAALEPSQHPNWPGAYAAKIMLDQASGVLHALTGERRERDDPESMPRLVEALAERYRLLLFGMVRADPVAVAISYAIASASGLWHANSPGGHDFSGDKLDEIAALARRSLPYYRHQHALIGSVKAALPQARWFDYDDCAARGFRLHDDLRDHAISQGFRNVPRFEDLGGDKEMFAKLVGDRLHQQVRARMVLGSPARVAWWRRWWQGGA